LLYESTYTTPRGEGESVSENAKSIEPTRESLSSLIENLEMQRRKIMSLAEQEKFDLIVILSHGTSA
jgi:hypothetical protein